MAQIKKDIFQNKNSFFRKAKVFLKHRDILKYTIYRFEWNTAFKRKKIRDFPVHLGIEPTNACNLNCEFCARRHIDYKIGFMDFWLYKKIIDEGVKHGLRSVKLVRGGESLLHPQFVEMIKYAKRKGIVDIMLNTSATLLTSQKSREIIEAKPDLVIFSVDSPEKESYEKQRVGANFEEVDENVRKFIGLKNKIYPRLIARAHMVYTEETAHLVPKHLARWRGVADEVTINKAKEYREQLTNEKFKCKIPFRRLDITWDGNVYLCDPDFDPKGKLLLGNTRNQSIYEIWHSDKLNQIRKIFRQKSPHFIDPCKYCHGI